jgi:hypothetical protein
MSKIKLTPLLDESATVFGLILQDYVFGRVLR